MTFLRVGRQAAAIGEQIFPRLFEPDCSSLRTQRTSIACQGGVNLSWLFVQILLDGKVDLIEMGGAAPLI
jgi:hypothetical protein